MPVAVTEHDDLSALHGHLAAGYLGILADWLRQAGHGDTALALEVEALAGQRQSRVPLQRYAALLDRAAAETGDADLGLHVGECVRPGHYGVAGYVAMNCATLGDALRQQLRYQALVADIGRAEIAETGEALQLSWDTRTLPPHRQAAEANLSAWIRFVRWASAAPVTPLQVEFRHPRPATITEHERIFGCPVRFSQPRHAVVFAPAVMKLPLAHPDEGVRQLMELHAQRLLAHLTVSDDPVARARAYIATHLAEGEVALAAVADHVGLTQRALQRRLQGQQRSFRSLVDEVRREQAEALLRNPALSLGEAAFLLGFSEQSAFQRAFRRWKNASPGAFRQQALRQALDSD
jgi:AraC-like DNA-binding protein